MIESSPLLLSFICCAVKKLKKTLINHLSKRLRSARMEQFLVNQYKEGVYEKSIGYRIFSCYGSSCAPVFAWLGRGDKNAADAAAVKAMRTMLNQIENER